MSEFFYLEGAYLILAVIILLVTVFVTTRPFMPRGAFKKGMGWVTLVLAILIGMHFYMTTNRMQEVAMAFEQGKTILCESRMQRRAAQVVYVQKSNGWRLQEHKFSSDYYVRPFFSARCIVE